MKTKFFVSVILFFGLVMGCTAQDYSKLKDITLKGKEDCAKAEKQVLECSEYVLTTPLDDQNNNRMDALKFIFRWMDGTPDFMFNLDESIGKLVNSNEELLGVYMACMSKFVLGNRDKAKDQDEVKYNSILMLIDYAQKPENSVEISGELQKLIDAKKDGSLKDYLKIDEGIKV
jgi:hypothetical protein